MNNEMLTSVFFLDINGGHELRNSDHDPIMTVMEILKW
jgi:hypothetical protein